jgi:RNA polymerase sigma factor (sigma-70 family)
MLRNSEQTEKLIDAFSTDYMEKLFYFCLKKTGSTIEAEDITSDITINIIKELRKGTLPEHFSAWVWKIAHNRYSVWADKKRLQSESISVIDIEETDIFDDILIEDEYMLNDDIKLLRRELAFISTNYREIVVAYYIDDRKVKDIALSLDLPEGTVMSKLFRSRNILKEGMKMAREFGVRSYKPADITFAKSGNDGWDQSPWKQLERSIAKNILLEAYYNPSTIEELSVELGVAMPYMEEEVKELVEVELLSKCKDKYETNFIILSKDAQNDIYNKQKEFEKQYFETARKIIDIIKSDFEKNNTVLFGGYQSFEELKWFLMLKLSDEAGWEAFNRKYRSILSIIKTKNYQSRPRGGNWELMGYETYTNDIPDVGLHGCGTSEVDFAYYKPNYLNLRERAGQLYEAEGKTLKKIVIGKADKCDMQIVEKLEERGFIRKNPEGEYFPTFPVAKSGSNYTFQAFQTLSKEEKKLVMPLYDNMVDMTAEFQNYIENRIKDETPQRLSNKIWFIVESISMRGYIIVNGVESGYLKIPENIENSTIAMAMKI